MGKRVLSILIILSIISSFMISLPIVANAETSVSGTCGDDLTWVLDDEGTLTISGTGDMEDWSAPNASPWAEYRQNIKTVILKEGITHIGDYSFSHCTELSSILFAESLESIGSQAFFYCSNLTNISLGTNIVKIGTYAFSYTGYYKDKSNWDNDVLYMGEFLLAADSNISGTCIVKEGTKCIEELAFFTCRNLNTIIMPESLETIEYEAFGYCENLTEVQLSNNLKTIDNVCFFNCVKLSSITIPHSVTYLGSSSFKECHSLKSVHLSNAINNVEKYTFENCVSLKSIKIYNNTKNILYGAFKNCSNLTDIYYTGSEYEWTNITINSYNECLSNATIHYNYINIGADKQSNSTSANAPIIKSAKLQYSDKTYDIINQSVNIEKNSGAKGNIVLDIDWKDVAVTNRNVYITQGASTKNDLTFGEYSYDYLIDTFTNFDLGKDFQADKPIYIIAIDKSNPEIKSASIVTKLNIIDLSKDEVYQESLTDDFNFKLGKDTEIQLPDDVPIIGGMKLSWKISPIPITVAYKSADIMSVAIGCNVVTENKDGIKKFKDFNFDKYKKSIIDAGKKQGRTLKQLRHDFSLSNDIKVSMFDNKILSGGSGDVDSGVDVLGYAEVKRGKDGEWKFDEVTGYIKMDVSVSYTYNGQVFVWVIPCYYEIGGELSAGFEADIESLDKASYAPQLTAYLNAALGINLGAGVGISKVATFGAIGSATLNLKKGLSDVLEDYIRILLEADAGYKLVVFGKTLVSDDLWKLSSDKGIIYSTDPEDENKTWIKSEPIALMSLDQAYNIYNANEIYENESREYLSTPMEWYGDMSPISLFATNYTNKNLTLLADSIYPEAQPQIFSVNGKKILVFTADDDTRTADNKQMLVYSVYNDEDGTWSKAVPVNDDGTADFYPSVSGEYLVWQNQKSVMDNGLSLAKIGRQGEIVIAKWNGNGFDEPVSLTNNDALDTLPKVSVNNNEISVVWLKNSADDILGIDGNTSIVKKVYNGSSWNEEIIVKDSLNAVTDLSIGYCENTLNVAYVHDVDNDITTIEDREVYLIGSAEKQITDNDVLDSNVIINNGKLYWYSENNIHFINLADGVESTVFEDARYVLADGFTVSEDDGNIAILWSGSEDEGSEIKGVLYQDDAWGDVITVSELGAYAKYPTCIFEEDGTILTSFTAEADGITSLYTLGLFPSYDLAITDIYFDEKNLALNSENEFEATVTNNGELPVDGYTINIYNEDETLNNSIVFEDTIKAGKSKAVVGKFVTGDTINYETLKVEIALNADEEYVYDNNSVNLSIGSGDISLESLSVYEILPTSYVVADVKNIGYSDISDITVNLRADSINGEVVQSKNVSSLASGSNEEVTFAYKPQDYENVKWYVTIEVESDEVSLGNNHEYFINECAVGLKDYEISILNYSYAEQQLTVNGYAKNNTNNVLVADAVFAVYSSCGKLKGITIQPLSVGGYSDTGIDVWFEDYTYASGDYVKMFMWSGLTNLKPIVNAEQVSIVIE